MKRNSVENARTVVQEYLTNILPLPFYHPAVASSPSLAWSLLSSVPLLPPLSPSSSPSSPVLCKVRRLLREGPGAEARKAANRVFWVGLEYRFIPPVRRLIEEIDAGTVGPLKLATVREHRFPFLKKVGHWNRWKVRRRLKQTEAD